ncbi:unnamed protein product [Pseudo-nitzschia multistriata]|uniref:EF-hand domain-containing protein n=1 Tax=Pseudo-nitzschia multistriata TaxID=183589 RepID=A0A448ZPI9_9STRA|nr:unnamed protein product [Pseudo-nitzschia multistriata]
MSPKKSSGGGKVLGLFPKKKKNQQQEQSKKSKQKRSASNDGRSTTSKSVASQEQWDRSRANTEAFSSANRASKRSLVALAYETTTSPSFRRERRKTGKQQPFPNGSASDSNSAKRSKANVPPPSTRSRMRSAARKVSGNKTTVETSITDKKRVSRERGWFSFLNPARSSFFQKLCDDTFDSIDVDGSGKIDESELYRGLLLIHLKLGIYFGAPACKPLSAENAVTVFQQLDTNRDGSLDKDEFRSVLTLLMGNVLFRIIFQFVCTLVMVPMLAQTFLEQVSFGWTWLVAVAVPLWKEYLPLLECALALDLVKKYSSLALSRGFELFETTVPLETIESIQKTIEPIQNTVLESWETMVMANVRDIPQETLDSLPLTIVSTMLTLIIVPYSILKTDEFFQFLARKISGGKKG